MTKGRRKQAYRLDQTALVADDPKGAILKTSDELGWPDINVTVTSGKPGELPLCGMPDLWIMMALDPLEVDIVIGGREHNLNAPANQMSIIAPETPWRLRWRNDNRILSVFVRHHILTEVANELFECDVRPFEGISDIGVENPGMAWLLHSLKVEVYEPQAHADLKVEHISRALAVGVLRKQTAPLHEGPVEQGQLTATQARLVADYIREHLSSKIYLKDLVALAGLGQTIFIQRFKASFGVPPYQYVTEVRISQARKLLEKSKLPIAQIATLCGFVDQAHLTVTFKRIVGMTPARYRQLS